MFCINVSVCHVSLMVMEERSPESGITNSHALPCGCWKSNPDPLEEETVLLTAEPSL